MRFTISALFLVILLAGCAAPPKSLQVEHTVPRTVALMPFLSKGGIGQQAANWVAQQLIQNGYIVVDSSFTTAAVSEAKFYDVGLSDEVRSALLAKNLTTLVFGNVNASSCEFVRSLNLLNNPVDKNRCTVSITAKMVDTATGKLIWEFMQTYSDEGKGLTALDVMKPLIITNISTTLPLPLPSPAATEVKPPAK